jgi:hypothetical protein
VNDRPEVNDLHRWARARLARWRAGLLSDDEAERLVAHLRDCETCGRDETAGPSAESDPGRHVPASLIARWPDARATLRGLERALVRRHLERCPECRQDLELLGHEPRLEEIAELETAVRVEPADRAEPVSQAAPPTTTIRIVKEDAGSRSRRLRDRALLAWASLATAAAAIAIVVLVRRPVIEGVPPLLFSLSPPPTAGALEAGGPSVRLAPRPRSLSGPARGPRGGKVTVIPVMGPVPSLALAVRPLDLPDTSWVQVSLVRGDRDTMLTVLHRQWEFFPKRMLVIDGGGAPLEPGRYALVLASLVPSDEAARQQMSRYLFELRPRVR